MIGIIDLGFGNLKSLSNALQFLDIEHKFLLEKTIDAEINDCSKLILPGVGSFSFASETILKSKVYQYLNDYIKDGKYLLGICLGMQLLFTKSTEGGESAGLDLIPGDCLCFSEDKSFNGTIPHVGYNTVSLSEEKDELWNSIPRDSPFYFIHSYRIDTTQVLNYSSFGTSCYSNTKFISYSRIHNVMGVQFHPEKSQKAGLKLLQNFCNLSETK